MAWVVALISGIGTGGAVDLKVKNLPVSPAGRSAPVFVAAERVPGADWCSPRREAEMLPLPSSAMNAIQRMGLGRPFEPPGQVEGSGAARGPVAEPVPDNKNKVENVKQFAPISLPAIALHHRLSLIFLTVMGAAGAIASTGLSAHAQVNPGIVTFIGG